MKKKVICLLISAMIATSVLSGCGDKDADRRAEEAMNNLGEALENGDEDAVMSALEELDRINEEEEAANSSESEEAYPADPRWADVKPTECAIQYNEIFIKSGMTLGEALEQIDNSDTFFTYYYDFDRDMKTETRPYSEKNKLYYIQIDSFTFNNDGQIIFVIKVPSELPGKEEDVYKLKESPIIGVMASSYGGKNKHLEGFRTLLGTHMDIEGMTKEDVENLQNTLFAGTNAELETRKSETNGTRYITYTYKIPTTTLWNGYYTEEYYIWYMFEVNVDEDKVTEWSVEGMINSIMDWYEE